MSNYFPVPFSSSQLHEFQGREEEKERESQENGPLTHLYLLASILIVFVVEFTEVGQVEGLFTFRLDYSVI